MMVPVLKLWGHLLRPTNGLGGTPVPTTPAPERPLKSSDEQTTENGVYNVKQLRDLTSSADVNALVEGYARWVMHATGQTQVAFWVSARAEDCEAERILVLAQCMDYSLALTWGVFHVPVLDANVLMKRVEFGLCLVHGGKMPVRSEINV